MLEVGNIDLAKRPTVRNPDGTISTVRSLGVNVDGVEVLIPTVSDDGRLLSDDEAIDSYRKSGRHLGKFKTPEEATTYARKLHAAQAVQHGGSVDEGMLRLYGDGMEAAIQRRLRNPGPAPEADFSTWSFLGAGFSGVPAGLLQVGGSAMDALSIAERESARRPRPLALRGQPADPARRSRGTSFVESAGPVMRRKATEFAPDPQTSHWADQMIFGLTRFGTKAAAAITTLGPVAGAAVLGVEEGNTVYRDLRAKGIDHDTALKVAGVQGGISAVGVALPISGIAVPGSIGVKAAATAGLTAVGGPGAYMAQEGLSRDILQRAGHEQEAALHDPADPLGLFISTILPGAFGALSVRGAAKRSQAVATGGVPLEQMNLAERQRLRYNAAQLDAYAERAADANGVPPALLLAIKNAGEKSGPTATSPKGARGVMQFMPDTAKEMGVADPTDPVQAIEGAARYLRKLFDAYGSWDAAVAHYNGGGAQAAIVRGGGKPTFPETAAYLERVQQYVRERTAGDGAARPEVVDAARVQVLEQTVARNLPDTPDAYAQVQRAADIVAEHGGRAAEAEIPAAPARLDVESIQSEAAQVRRDFSNAGTQESADWGGNPDHHVGAFFEAHPELSNRDAHGMSAGGDVARRLDDLLRDGVDRTRDFHSVEVGSRGTMQNADRVNDMAAFVVLGRADGTSIRDGGIETVVVNGGHAFAVDRLAAAHPGVEFIDATTGRTHRVDTAPDAVAGRARDADNTLPPADGVAVEAPAPPKSGARGPSAPADGGSPASGLPTLDASVAKQLAGEQPDLTVTLPGSDERLTLTEALARIQEDQKLEASDAELVRVAAECALMN